MNDTVRVKDPGTRSLHLRWGFERSTAGTGYRAS